MSAFTLYPLAAGYTSAWGIGAGSRPTCVQTNDAGTSYITKDGSIAGIDAYTLDDLPGGAATVNGNVTANGYWGRSAINPGNANNGFRYSGTNGFGGAFTCPPSWTLQSDAFAQAPGAVPWTPAVLNLTEILCQDAGTGTGGVFQHVTQLYATGDYTPGSGGFAYLIASHILPLLGAAIPLSKMRELALAVWRTKLPGIGRTLILPHEYELAWREWAAYRHPRFA